MHEQEEDRERARRYNDAIEYRMTAMVQPILLAVVGTLLVWMVTGIQNSIESLSKDQQAANVRIERIDTVLNEREIQAATARQSVDAKLTHISGAVVEIDRRLTLLEAQVAANANSGRRNN